MASFLYSQQKTIHSAAILLMGAALASRLLGLVRDRILAASFGAGDELDIYFAAFRIPDFIFSIFFAGALSAAFIPIFLESYRENKDYAWRIAVNAFHVLGFLSAVGAMAGALAMPYIVSLVAPGFDGDKKEMTVLLSRIMLLSPFFLGLSAVLSDVNQALNRFVPYAIAPSIYNVGIIAGAIFFVPIFGITGLAWGVVLGAVLHFAIQIPSALSLGCRFYPIFSFGGFEFTRMIKLLLPRAIGLVASQINFWVITAIASLLSAGSVTIFNLANNIQYLPIGIVGLSFATASFPSLSRYAPSVQKEEFLLTLSLVIRQILFVVLPASVLLYVLRAQVVRVVYGAGLFGWDDTRLTAAVLGIFCFGIFAHSIIPAISRAFYATQDTMTPVLINTFGIALNIGLSVLFVFVFFQDGVATYVAAALRVSDLSNIPILGLPIAFVISGVITFVFLVWVFFKRYDSAWKKEIIASFMRLGVLSVVSGFAAYGALRLLLFLFPFISLETFWGVFFQGLGAGFVGIAVYAGGLFLLNFPERKFLSQLSKIFGASGDL